MCPVPDSVMAEYVTIMIINNKTPGELVVFCLQAVDGR